MIAPDTAITNPIVTNYTETLNAPAAGANFAVSLVNGTIHKLTTNADATITLPAAAAGKSYVVIVAFGGAHSLTWAGGGTIKWAGGAAPVPSSAAGKFDVYTFFSDGTNTYGAIFGVGF